MRKSLLISLAAMLSTGAYAQYISLAPEGGFNVANGKDYVVLYAPDQIIAQMGQKGVLATNDNLDPDGKKNTLEYWVTDWDKSLLTIYNVPENPPVENSFGITGEYINATPLQPWGSGVFMPKTEAYDLSKVTNEHHIHIGFRDFGSAPSQYKMQLGPQNSIKTNGFSFEIGLETGKADGDFVGVGTAGGNDDKWYYLDLPISELVDPDGDFGFEYNFSQPIKNTGVFLFQFNKPTCSTYTAGPIPPGGSVKDITIDKLGSALSIDHVFFYIPTGSGIEDVADNSPETIEAVYTLDGRRVSSMDKGVYIVRTNKGARKVIR